MDVNDTSQEEFDPFSPETAVRTLRSNREISERLLLEIDHGIDTGEQVRVLLDMAVEAIGRMTDNTILKRIIDKALENREKESTDNIGNLPDSSDKTD